jgi:hypothetical protein
MNDLESLLSGLAPRGPSQALHERIAHDLELDRQWLHDRYRPRRWLGPLGWAAAGAAATLAVSAVLAPPAGPATVAAQPTLLPAGTIREVVHTEDEGIAFNEAEQTHEQRLRLYSVERQDWIDPRDGARITVERPREEHLVLPVSYQ